MKTGYMHKALLAPVMALGLIVAASALPASAQTAASVGKIALRDQSNLSLRLAAESGLRAMTLDMARGHAAGAKLPSGFPIPVATYGDLQKLSLGAGFEVNTIDPAALMYAKRDADLSRIARGTDAWKFFIVADGKPVALLDVGKVDGRWQAIGAGSSDLAADLAATAPMTGDGSFRFVRIYQATSDLVEVRGAGGGSRFVPMRSAQHALSIPSTAAKTQALSSESLLPALQTAVRGNLQRGQR